MKKNNKIKNNYLIIAISILLLIGLSMNFLLLAKNSINAEERAAIHLNLAQIYSSRGELDKTQIEINKAITICPRCDLAYSMLGDVLFETGEFNNSVDAYQTAYSLNNDEEYYFDIGNVYYKTNNPEKAQEYYRKVIEQNPNATNAYLNIANILIDQKRFPESKVYYDKAMELEPYNSNIHNDIGAYYATIGDIEKARQEYETALRLNPNNNLARTNLEKLN